MRRAWLIGSGVVMVGAALVLTNATVIGRVVPHYSTEYFACLVAQAALGYYGVIQAGTGILNLELP